MEQTLVLQGPQKTILVVDDDESVLSFVSGLLVRRNYSVITAKSGPEGLEQSRTYNSEIHLLLTDFQMPEMNGLDLATRLNRERPQIKVLLMSGFSDGMLVRNEGWHFIAKPFVKSQLCALVSGLIG